MKKCHHYWREHVGCLPVHCPFWSHVLTRSPLVTTWPSVHSNAHVSPKYPVTSQAFPPGMVLAGRTRGEHRIPVIIYMLRYHLFPQEGINRSLVTWLNGKVDYMLIPCTRSCLFCIVCSGMEKQRVVTLADFVTPKATGRIVPQTNTYFNTRGHCISSKVPVLRGEKSTWI